MATFLARLKRRIMWWFIQFSLMCQAHPFCRLPLDIRRKSTEQPARVDIKRNNSENTYCLTFDIHDLMIFNTFSFLPTSSIFMLVNP